MRDCTNVEVRDYTQGEPVFGWSAVVEVPAPRGNTPLPPLEPTVTKEIRRKGSRATIVRAAGLVRGCIRIVRLEKFSEAAYIRAFGWGRM